MRIGVTIGLTDRSIGPAELAKALEERGFYSLYVSEHTHIPTSSRVSGVTGEKIPEYCKHLLDPFAALATAVAVTSELRVGTGICLVAQHDPIALAKAVATLDHLSKGRFTLGVGFGWNRDEIKHHRIDYARRRNVVWEYLAAMRNLWQPEPAAFEGEFISFGPSEAWPKPTNGSVPVLIGAPADPRLFAQIAEHADGWMPIGARGLSEQLPVLRGLFADAGRDETLLRIVPSGTLPSQGKLEHLRRLGVTEVLCQLPSGPADEVLPVLDEYAQYIG
ncbi:TIGR03619 family F420-dependent LLM class oxidoreductase [Streptomyces sp. NPDC050439]|uniref:TIGR03619 family F420-dependent LLM class oxidoreductase n=1 Tax=unclassified Streptomyces TaxID=2593676 RepID=UPI003440933F